MLILVWWTGRCDPPLEIVHSLFPVSSYRVVPPRRTSSRVVIMVTVVIKVLIYMRHASYVKWAALVLQSVDDYAGERFIVSVVLDMQLETFAIAMALCYSAYELVRRGCFSYRLSSYFGFRTLLFVPFVYSCGGGATFAIKVLIYMLHASYVQWVALVLQSSDPPLEKCLRYFRVFVSWTLVRLRIFVLSRLLRIFSDAGCNTADCRAPSYDDHVHTTPENYLILLS